MPINQSLNTGNLPGKLTPCQEVDFTDAFVLSLSQLLSPVSYRAHAEAHMEVLRRANGYQFATYSAPTKGIKTVPAYSQIEEQWTITPGTYLWGWAFSVTTSGEGLTDGNFHVMLTDACTETALSDDYIIGSVVGGPTSGPRWPFLFPSPRLISDPGKVNVEIYNNFSTDVTCQLVVFAAQPILLAY